MGSDTRGKSLLELWVTTFLTLDQLWRRQNNRIISAKFGNTFKKDRPLVLTMDSNGNVFVKTPNIDALQEWILEEKEGIKKP